MAKLMDLSVRRPSLIEDWLAESSTVIYRFIDLGFETYRVYWGTPTGSDGVHRVSAALANEMLSTLRQDGSFTIKCTSHPTLSNHG